MTLGCNNSKNIIGHWHILRLNEQKDQSQTPYFVLDVLNDTLAYFGTNSIKGTLEGEHKRKERRLNFPGDCGSGHLTYKINGDQIFLENHLGDKYAGKKCYGNCCNRLEDFTKDLKITINFPRISNKRDYFNPKSIPFGFLSEEIIIGIPKKEFQRACRITNKMELSGKFSLINDLKFWVDSVKLKYPETHHDIINYKIIADEKIPIPQIKEIVDELITKGINRIWITCLRKDYLDEIEIFEYVPAGKIELNSNLKLGQIL